MITDIFNNEGGIRLPAAGSPSRACLLRGAVRASARRRLLGRASLAANDVDQEIRALEQKFRAMAHTIAVLYLTPPIVVGDRVKHTERMYRKLCGLAGVAP